MSLTPSEAVERDRDGLVLRDIVKEHAVDTLHATVRTLLAQEREAAQEEERAERYQDTMSAATCDEHNRELVFCGTCLANRMRGDVHDPSRSIARMMQKFDDEDRVTLNFLIAEVKAQEREAGAVKLEVWGALGRESLITAAEAANIIRDSR